MEMKDIKGRSWENNEVSRIEKGGLKQPSQI